MSVPLHFADPSTWDPDDDELHRAYDSVPPDLELRLASEPDESTLTRIAEVLVRNELVPDRPWERVLVCGPFVRVCSLASTSARAVERAAVIVLELAKVVDLTEAAMLVPLAVPQLADPGPAWPGRRVRPVGGLFPAPAPHPVIEDVLLGEERREALARTGIVATYGEPTDIAGLSRAIASHGQDYPDDAGHSRRLLELLRWEEPAAGHTPMHVRVFGLLDDGRFALAGSSSRKGKPFDASKAPVPGWILLQPRSAFFNRLAAGLRRYGLEASFDPDPILRNVIGAFGDGRGLHRQVLPWLAASSLADDPGIVEILERGRDDAHLGDDIEAFLTRNDPKAPSQQDKRARRKANRKAKRKRKNKPA